MDGKSNMYEERNIIGLPPPQNRKYVETTVNVLLVFLFIFMVSFVTKNYQHV